MRTKHFLFCGLLLVAAFFPSCSSSLEDETDAVESRKVTYKIRLDASLTEYDGLATRAATDWADGSKIVMQFHQGNNLVGGTAVFNADEALWTVTVPQTLSTDADALCEAYYFESAASQTAQTVTFGAATVAYADRAGTFVIDEETGTVLVKARLAPVTSRLRLVGTSGSTYGITGLQTFTSYSVSNNTFATSTAKVSGTIASDGYSPFVYALFADTTKRSLSFDYLPTARFTRSFGSDVLRAGTSGRIHLPSLNSLDTWTLVNTTDGKEITMPSITSATSKNVTYLSATLTATANAGNGTITAAGFVYAKSPATPTMSSTKAEATPGTQFSLRISKLESETTYNIRAYVTNERGNTLGQTFSITTTAIPPGTTFDLDDFGNEDEWD